jgi:hypothetical protein
LEIEQPKNQEIKRYGSGGEKSASCRAFGADGKSYGTFDKGLTMMADHFRVCLPILITIATWSEFPLSGTASDDLPRSSRVGPLRIPLTSYERIPIETVLAHPDRYQMREIRLIGTVMSIQTETITNRLICGRAHERTTLLVEDESGQIEIIDQGACGRNQSSLKAPMLKVGQQINLLVLINTPTRSDASAVEATIRFLDLVQE